LRLWDVTTGHPIKDLFTGHTNRVYSFVSVAFSPDGKTLASCGISGPVRLWDGATGGGTTATGPPTNGTTARTDAPNGS
jgi:WD40 repeat protein